MCQDDVEGVATATSNHMPTTLTPEIITAAILGFEEQKRRIDSRITEFRALLDGSAKPTAATPEAPAVKRRKFSAAARRRMKEAQQLRWARIRGESEPSSQVAEPKPKRKLTKAGRAAIVAALKKRWAMKRAEAEKAQPAKAKKAGRKGSATNKAAKKSASVRKSVKKSAPAAEVLTKAAGHEE